MNKNNHAAGEANHKSPSSCSTNRPQSDEIICNAVVSKDENDDLGIMSIFLVSIYIIPASVLFAVMESNLTRLDQVIFESSKNTLFHVGGHR